MQNVLLKALCVVTVCLGASAAPMTVRLVSNLPSPQPVGTSIGLVPRTENAKQAKHAVRYSVSVNSGPFHVVRDFSQATQFIWAPALYEHEARVRVEVRNNETKETAQAELPFQIVSRVKDSQPIVTPTANPLVALFAAPPCPVGSRFRVAFERSGDTGMSHTSAQDCRHSVSNNVYVAGMRADTEYRMRSEVLTGSEVETGTWMPFHTGLSDGKFPPASIPVARAPGSRVSDPLIIYSLIDPWRVLAADLDGNVTWYLQEPVFLTRVLPDGHFLVIADGDNSDNDMKRWQLVREVDLAGHTLHETNISRVAEQLASRGIKSSCKKGNDQCVSSFHHEVIRLPNGHSLAIAGLERMFPANTQKSKERVDILGDLIVDLDEDFQVAWVWNSFDHLDIERASLGDEKCKGGPGDDGCTPVFLADAANGWLHSNSLDYLPSDGNLVVSIPEQDWVAKIDYQNGKGAGKVLWRLGPEGDFAVKSDDPYPWFSYQHDVRFEPGTPGLLTLFDDGHQRKKRFPQSNNRGQVWKLDEQSRTASLVYNADLGVYAVAVGSAQTLSGGGYSFEAGFVNPASPFSRAIETSADGKVVYAQQLETMVYRSFRAADLYSAPAALPPHPQGSVSTALK